MFSGSAKIQENRYLEIATIHAKHEWKLNGNLLEPGLWYVSLRTDILAILEKNLKVN